MCRIPCRCTAWPKRPNIFIAGVEGLKDFSPALAAQGLATRKGYIGKNIVPVILPSPFPLQRDLSTLDLARYLDTPEGILWLSKSLNKYIVRGVPGAVFVPAILGTAANNDVHNAIKDRTGHIVNEISSLPPAVTGLRLHALLLRLLKKYDVDLIEQSTITGAVVENGRCAALITTNNGRSAAMRRVPSSSPRAACSAKGSPSNPNAHGSRSSILICP